MSDVQNPEPADEVLPDEDLDEVAGGGGADWIGGNGGNGGNGGGGGGSGWIIGIGGNGGNGGAG